MIIGLLKFNILTTNLIFFLLFIGDLLTEYSNADNSIYFNPMNSVPLTTAKPSNLESGKIN